jgi:protein-disulfide isomerase
MTLDGIARSIAVTCALVVTALVVRREFASGASPASQAEIAEPVGDWEKLKGRGHRWGSLTPKVTLVVFGDFQCPGCRRFALEALETVEAQFPKEVEVVFRHWPLERIHSVAFPAARAAECAGRQGKFREMHDALFTAQDSLGRRALALFARDAGVADSASFANCMSEPGRPAAIQADIEDAVAVGGSGTPTVLINGLRYARVPDRTRLARLVKYHSGLHDDSLKLKGATR